MSLAIRRSLSMLPRSKRFRTSTKRSPVSPNASRHGDNAPRAASGLPAVARSPGSDSGPSKQTSPRARSHTWEVVSAGSPRSPVMCAVVSRRHRLP